MDGDGDGDGGDDGGHMEEEAKRGSSGSRWRGVGGSSCAGRPQGGAPPLSPLLHDFLGMYRSHPPYG